MPGFKRSIKSETKFCILDVFYVIHFIKNYMKYFWGFIKAAKSAEEFNERKIGDKIIPQPPVPPLLLPAPPKQWL